LKTMRIKDSHNIFAFGQIMGVDTCSIGAKLQRVESKWRHDVPMSARRFSAPETDHFASLTSVSKIFNLFQFCSPLFGHFRLVPGFVESQQLIQ
ncbi:MAG: hypothetical protein ACYTEK_07915, partial [Planctomycetota bacterium]